MVARMIKSSAFTVRHRERDSRPCGMQAFIDDDMLMQSRWLARQAGLRGYSDLSELLGEAPELFAQLAAMWRRAHPAPRIA